MIGTGPSEQQVIDFFSEKDLAPRFHHAGKITGEKLVDAYHSMDVFAYASQTETQGLVLTEAMASGVPVIALDGPVINEIVRDGVNGRLLKRHTVEYFSDALAWAARIKEHKMQALKQNAQSTAAPFSRELCAERALHIYNALLRRKRRNFIDHNDSAWSRAKRMIKAELDLLRIMTKATGAAITEGKGKVEKISFDREAHRDDQYRKAG